MSNSWTTKPAVRAELSTDEITSYMCCQPAKYGFFGEQLYELLNRIFQTPTGSPILLAGRTPKGDPGQKNSPTVAPGVALHVSATRAQTTPSLRERSREFLYQL